MSVTQDYKITHKTLELARFALAARISYCSALLETLTVSGHREYWLAEREGAQDAFDELGSLL